MMNKAVTVLCAEDDLLVRTEIKELMERRGWRVLEAVDGNEAIRLHVDNDPDVIVLDVDMPRCSGIEALQSIRAIDMQTPIIIYSGLKAEAEMQVGYLGGANVYMIKDYTPSTLMMQVEKYVYKNREILTINDEVYYDTSTFTLYSSQGNQKLSILENKVFAILCKNKNKLSQRLLLLRVGWGEDGLIYELQLNKVINKLRDISMQLGAFEIITDKGRGYWLMTRNVN